MKSPESGGYEPHISPEKIAKKILWVSRHKPKALQVKKLSEIFGRIKIDLYPNRDHWRSAEKIAKFFWEGGYAEMVVVLPLSVIEKLCKKGIKPLWVQMNHVYDPDKADLQYNGRFYRFDGFRRIDRIDMVFSDIWNRGEVE